MTAMAVRAPATYTNRIAFTFFIVRLRAASLFSAFDRVATVLADFGGG